MSDLKILASSGPEILRLPDAITADSTEEEVLEMTVRVKAIATLARAVASQATEALNEAWERYNDGQGKSVQTERLRFYYGTTKEKSRRVPVRDILEYLLAATGGDLDAVAGTLASDAFKLGALRKAIGDQAFADRYVVEDVVDVKTGKPKKGLKSIPTQDFAKI